MDVNVKDKRGTTAMGLAVRDSDNAKFKLLLKSVADLGAERKPSLIGAAARGNQELVIMLLRLGSDPNILGDSEMSTLSSAMRERNKEIVIALLEAGADPNLLDKIFLTPLGRAVGNKDKEIGERRSHPTAGNLSDTVRFIMQSLRMTSSC